MDKSEELKRVKSDICIIKDLEKSWPEVHRFVDTKMRKGSTWDEVMNLLKEKQTEMEVRI